MNGLKYLGSSSVQGISQPDMSRKKKEYSRYAVAADVIGLTHMIVGTVSILIGEYTEVFQTIDYKHGGVQFVLHYLDAPIYWILAPFLPIAGGDTRYVMMVGLAVVALGSIIYAVFAYYFLKFAVSLFNPNP